MTRQEQLSTDMPQGQLKCGMLTQRASEYLHCV